MVQAEEEIVNITNNDNYVFRILKNDIVVASANSGSSISYTFDDIDAEYKYNNESYELKRMNETHE